MTRHDIPYSEIDANMRNLVRILNLYPYVETIGCCGGHAEQTNLSQYPEGSFYVKLTISPLRAARYALEHLAWAINNDYRRAGHAVVFMPTAPPPYLNTPGECMNWVIEGDDEDPEELASALSMYLDYLVPKAYGVRS